MKKKKNYKLNKKALGILILLVLIIIIVIIFLLSLFKSKSYSLEYTIDDYKISENFDDKKKIYYYEITYNDIKYNFIYESKYINERKLINKIDLKEDNGDFCLLISSDYIKSNPLCSSDGKIIDYHLVNDNLLDELNVSNEEIEGTQLNNYILYDKDETFIIWDYKGFNYVSNGKIEFISLFSDDIYEVPLATKINEYLVVPDYEQSYNFNKVYIINLDNLKVEEWELKYEIPFDSYILGTNNKSIFLLDNKNKIEYELVPHKEKMRIVAKENGSGIIYENGEQKKVSMNKLATTTYKFSYDTNYIYKLKNNILYLSYENSSIQTKISNLEVDSIIYQNDDKIYYLVDDILYKYDINNGESKIIEYSEWEFNNKNQIFIKN